MLKQKSPKRVEQFIIRLDNSSKYLIGMALWRKYLFLHLKKNIFESWSKSTHKMVRMWSMNKAHVTQIYPH